MIRMMSLVIPAAVLLISHVSIEPAWAQSVPASAAIDAQVKVFLDSHRSQWHGNNVPPSDGRLLYELIIKEKYTQVLEIGTSTGYSAIWMAWALSKTGGKLVTVEIDESRYSEAQANFKAAGLSPFIDARLADAHDLVGKLDGPFDLVFCDADKEWYTKYFQAVAQKIKVSGCFAAHNVTNSRRRFGTTWELEGTQAFLRHVLSRPDFTTTVDESGGGMSLSFKNSPK